MRSTLRLLAKVKPGTFLEPNTPTGLTGLTTHPAPRPALILTYRNTLEKLKLLPESSVYRQSAEALTKHRLSIIESAKPEGYDEWLSRVRKQIEASPDAYKGMIGPDGSFKSEKIPKETLASWNGEYVRGMGLPEGSQTAEEANAKGKKVQEEVEEREKAELPTVEDLEPEPPLDAQQINDIEEKIGAGLIEEVLQVAEGELELVSEMAASRVWDPLEEKADPGQWKYHERPSAV